MRLTLLDYVLMLEAGPLDAGQRAVVQTAKRSYAAMERGDSVRILRELKVLIATAFRLVNHIHEQPNQIRAASQADLDAF